MDAPALLARLQRALPVEAWWPARGPLEVVVGALLTQQTTWTSVERALEALRREGLLTLAGLADAPPGAVEACVRPTGFYRVKARRLRAIARRVREAHGSVEALLAQEDRALREELLGLPGVGPETADSILLYAADRPFLPVDAYTRRILRRLGTPLPRGYEAARRRLEEGLPPDPGTYGAFHALLVEVGKRWCRPRPRCAPCPLLEACPHGQATVRPAP